MLTPMRWMPLSLIILVVPSFGQTAKTQTATTDYWDKMKDCATQAEKIIAERQHGLEASKTSIVDWQNHYSPKYNRCFLTITFKDATTSPPDVYRNMSDAFERSSISGFSFSPKYPEGECYVEDSTLVDCVRARAFISEHMKN
jgi:hypothetical protein